MNNHHLSGLSLTTHNVQCADGIIQDSLFFDKAHLLNFLTRIMRIMLIHADKNKKKIRVNPPNPLNPRSIF